MRVNTAHDRGRTKTVASVHGMQCILRCRRKKPRCRLARLLAVMLNLNLIAMLLSYIKLAWRTLSKNKVYSLIIVSGLALAYCACLLIFLYVRQEISYDKQSPDASRIHRVVKDFVNDDGTFLPDATTPPAIAPAIQQEISSVESVIRLFPSWGSKALIRVGDQSYYEPQLYRADSNFFSFFNLHLLQGDEATALTQPNQVVLTQSTAHKYFGDEPALGKNITIGEGESSLMTVSGIIADLPPNLHFHFDLLIAIREGIDEAWGWYNFYTYIKLKPGTTIADVEPQVIALFKSHRPSDTWTRYYTQPLTDIHLNSKLKWELEPNGDQTFVNIFVAVAILILLIASVNYINLSIVQSLSRSKEVGIRKVSGAAGSKLINQFLLESTLVSLVSFAVAFILVETLVPFVNQRFSLFLPQLSQLPLPTLAIIVGIGALVGLAAGLYPSVYLSAFKPAEVLKGVFSPGRGNLWVRKALVVLQFSISIALISGALIVFGQVTFLHTRALGFDKDHVVIVENLEGIQNIESVRVAFGNVPQVENVGTSNGVLGGQNWTNTLAAKGQTSGPLVNFTVVDHDYIKVMGLEIVAGRNFDPALDPFARTTRRVILNETAVRDLGITGDPIGALVTDNPNDDTVQYQEVIGVIKDFHFASLRNEIKPYAFFIGQNWVTNVAVKINAANPSQALAGLEDAWQKLAPGKPFEYYFLDDSLVKLYSAEEDFKLVFSALTLMAIYIACSGLFAIASYFIRRRTKEIGIRKVLGASVRQIAWLVSAEFIVIILLANVIAWPLAWYFMDGWLDGFAYRIDLGGSYFPAATAIALIVATATITFQSVKAAVANPVRSLRND